MCLPVHAMVELQFSDRPMIVSGLGNGLVVPGRVYDANAPAAMVWHFGHATALINSECGKTQNLLLSKTTTFT